MLFQRLLATSSLDSLCVCIICTLSYLKRKYIFFSSFSSLNIDLDLTTAIYKISTLVWISLLVQTPNSGATRPEDQEPVSEDKTSFQCPNVFSILGLLREG